MKISSYVLLALVILATGTPTLALADSDDYQGSYQIQGQQSSPAPTQTQHQGSDTGHTVISTISSLVLYGTISAILWVVGYSACRVYKVRRKVVSRNLV